MERPRTREEMAAYLGSEERAQEIRAARLAQFERQLAETKVELERRITAGGNARYWRKKLAELLEVERWQREDVGLRGGVMAVPKLKPLKPPKAAPNVQVEDRGYTHSCEVCGRRFTGVRADALYCSNACRQKAYRDRQD
jgi:hypothetical protein